MRFAILICLLASGCAVHQPPEYESSAVASICGTEDGGEVSVTYNGEVKRVGVDFVDSWDELYFLCGATGGACTAEGTNVIHILRDRRCEQHASHELAHIFDVMAPDAVRQTALVRSMFNNGQTARR
ncbi:hypothetical protein [Pseudohalioglobus lutimaris]|uniref:Uncharacterized protein n=1 Tax=Pseudohalioglobus lutimaris TaxID=1737061 RepID=A0A2N5X1N3_9GAMM|nr:hypothetical protein [Pseudohalioglobus lutimaris]PLW68407.1 hypothetical protein C0039_12785 [Pseudohalioglobus lutimaris]